MYEPASLNFFSLDTNNRNQTLHHVRFIIIDLFVISQLWLTSHPRSTMVLLDTGTSGTSRKIYSEDADDKTRTRSPLLINRVL